MDDPGGRDEGRFDAVVEAIGDALARLQVAVGQAEGIALQGAPGSDGRVLASLARQSHHSLDVLHRAALLLRDGTGRESYPTSERLERGDRLRVVRGAEPVGAPGFPPGCGDR